MKNLIIVAVLFFVVSAFGFEKCMHTIDHSEIAIERIVPSAERSFNDCPSSILLNHSFVRWLTNVKEVDGKPACVYGTLGTNITCIK